ncbi:MULTISPECIES: glycosyltransferase family 2 protein [unclassified Thioclava]|uniref:glycosyltransferase family 2 protein n=1 Tax=unclassified Thioclava TaxID=2621713 RepID=UPI000B53D20A|nr:MULTISPECIES: glycosyltransferase family 2 protein [unclassified Thioclava]OWY04248.1 hypothetical protein B6V76_06880 [Thioclava sp. IC9]PWE51148.1 hypothetical protein DEM26_04465 [Thioclava sp. NG1]
MTQGQDMPRWGVVATVDEPAALVAAYVAHHLSIGASEVHVFFDRPNPEAEALLAPVEGAFIHHSGDDDWERSWRRKRPARHQGRQKYNATRALTETELDWMIHCDADEFVSLVRPLEWELAKTGEQKAWLRLEVDERCYLDRKPGPDIFSGVFRRRWDGFQDDGLMFYGFRARFLKKGLAGHVAGKPVVRAGRGYAIGVHYPLKDWDSKENDLPYRPSYNGRLMHFDGLTPLHFILKMLRRATTKVKGQPVPYVGSRKAQFAEAAERAADPAELKALWWEVQGMRDYEAAELEAHELLIRPDVKIAAETRALFGDRVDLSPASFDHALLLHEAELIARLKDEFGFDPEPLVSSA